MRVKLALCFISSEAAIIPPKPPPTITMCWSGEIVGELQDPPILCLTTVCFLFCNKNQLSILHCTLVVNIQTCPDKLYSCRKWMVQFTSSKLSKLEVHDTNTYELFLLASHPFWAPDSECKRTTVQTFRVEHRGAWLFLSVCAKCSFVSLQRSPLQITLQLYLQNALLACLSVQKRASHAASMTDQW